VVRINRIQRFLAVLVAALGLSGSTIVVTATPALAYYSQGAANYADYWAKGRNGNYPSFGSDCTNFVSQAVHEGGGYSYIGRNQSTTDNHLWWVSWSSTSGFRYSNSWIRVQDFYEFLILDYPGGWYQGTAPGTATYYWTPDTVVTGDVLFYDWDNNGIKDHASIQVGWGQDPDSGWSGNYIDQHTTDRFHAFWSLRPYNSQYASTVITFMHIDYRNV
jgi:hypothetical protein